jgi:hypothetical protein
MFPLLSRKCTGTFLKELPPILIQEAAVLRRSFRLPDKSEGKPPLRRTPAIHQESRQGAYVTGAANLLDHEIPQLNL